MHLQIRDKQETLKDIAEEIGELKTLLDIERRETYMSFDEELSKASVSIINWEEVILELSTRFFRLH